MFQGTGIILCVHKLKPMIRINYMQSLFTERDELFNNITTQYATGDADKIFAAIESYEVASNYCTNIQELIDAGLIDCNDAALKIRCKK